MEWTPDDYDIPVTLPGNLRELEKLGTERLSAMTRQEIEDRLQDAAKATASNFKEQVPDGDYESCVLVVSTIFKKVGADIDTKVGATMVAESDSWAKAGCSVVFSAPNPFEENL